MGRYLLGIDQSTQGTKGLILNEKGELLYRHDFPHRQIVDDKGWVSHDLMEIYKNTLLSVEKVIEKSGIDKGEIVGVGISNQRETTAAWDRKTGEPIDNAIVWQCARGESVCKKIDTKENQAMISARTGIPLSPYFPAAKMAWFIENHPQAAQQNKDGTLCLGTVDAWLIYCLTDKKIFKTDFSNASRTQLLNLNTLKWDEEICGLFGVNPECLPEICDSNSLFGMTDFNGYFERSIPIQAVLGDSHGALFGQGCHEEGMVKTTYGTGSSIMMNVGEEYVASKHGVVTSLAWGMDGKVQYVLEGNINYTGAVITWLKDDLQLIDSPLETQEIAQKANPMDKTYLVPAFSGLGAPYWDSEAPAVIYGITRKTGKAEIVKAALECIAYQIEDILKAMEQDAGIPIKEIRVDGGPTKNKYLMQFQSDISNISVQAPNAEELSGIGAAYMAGLAMGVYEMSNLFTNVESVCFSPEMDEALRKEKYEGWRKAVGLALAK